MSIYNNALKIKNELIEHRKILHQIPELGLELPMTSKYIEDKLKEMGYIPKRIGHSGIMCTIGSGEKCFLIRGDMDALPVEEQTGLDYRSTNGNMHACGHDCHMAAMLGAAKLLKLHEHELKGQVKLIFQPAEETMEGAKMMVESGILSNPSVNAALGLHVFANLPFPAGTIAMLGADGIFAAVDWFEIKIKGQSCHGAQPHKGVDPINVLAHIFLALQNINSREMDPTDNIVLTIGQVHSGSTSNVVPEEAMMSGTLRTISNKTRAEVKERMENLVRLIAASFKAEAHIEWGAGCPVLNNDKKLHGEIKKYLRALNDINVIDYSEIDSAYKTMVSEDFAYIANEIPSVYMLISGGSAEEGYCYPQHHAKAIFSDDAIPVAATAYAHAAIEWLKEHQ